MHKIDVIVLNFGDVLPNTMNFLYSSLKEFDLTILVNVVKPNQDICTIVNNYFKGESLHVVIFFLHNLHLCHLKFSI